MAVDTAPEPISDLTDPHTGTSDEPVPVVYLAGFGRSGSTLIGRLLGELPRVVFAGELNFFWSDALVAKRPCGCGVQIAECPYWSKVLELLGPDVLAEAAEVGATLRGATRMRRGIVALAPTGSRQIDHRLDAVTGHIDRLYRAIATAFDADVVVDSSKSLTYLRALARAQGVSVRPMHIVRDPRAAAASWRTPKREAVGGVELPTFGVGRSSVEWSVSNLLALEACKHRRSALLRYEDFVTTPAEELTRAGVDLGFDFSAVPIRGGHAELGVSHTVAGNPDRFAVGRVEIRPDERWRMGLSRSDRAVVRSLTAPVSRRLGY
jgi:hypothetical protein